MKKTNVRVYIIRFLLESCIELGLIAMICVVTMNALNWSTWQESVSSLLAFLTLALLLFAPFKLAHASYKLLTQKKTDQ